MLNIRFSVYSFVLPLLAGLAAFSSKSKLPDSILEYICSLLLFVVLSLIFIKNFKYKRLAWLICAVTVVAKMLILFDPGVPVFRLVYTFSYFLVVMCAGASLLLLKPVMLLKQMYWISFISTIMSLLQIEGVLWAQEIGSALDWKVATNLPVLFQGYSPDLFREIGVSQTRPDGFTHANNLTSQLLLFFYAYGYFYYSFETNLIRRPLIGFFLIAFACALNAGKVVILGIVVINLFAWIFLKGKNNMRLSNTFVITLLAYTVYFILFPGLFINNFNADVFIFDAMGRVINIQNLYGYQIFQPVVNLLSDYLSNYYVNVANPEQYLHHKMAHGAISGIASIMNYWVVIISCVPVIGVLWFRSLGNLSGMYIRNFRYLSIFMLIALICSIFGGPFISTIWFAFFVSFVLVPLVQPHLSGQINQAIFELHAN